MPYLELYRSAGSFDRIRTAWSAGRRIPACPPGRVLHIGLSLLSVAGGGDAVDADHGVRGRRAAVGADGEAVGGGDDCLRGLGRGCGWRGWCACRGGAGVGGLLGVEDAARVHLAVVPGAGLGEVSS